VLARGRVVLHRNSRDLLDDPHALEEALTVYETADSTPQRH
jgi:hypothetical protein